MSDDGIMEAFFMGQSHARLKIINDVDNDRSAVAAELITAKADRDAYKFLAESLLIKHGNIRDLANILADAHKKSWEAQIANYEIDNGCGLSDPTLKRAKKLSAECVASYAREKSPEKTEKKQIVCPPPKTFGNQVPDGLKHLFPRS